MRRHPFKDHDIIAACRQGYQQCHICPDKRCGDNRNPRAKHRVDAGPFLLAEEYWEQFAGNSLYFYWDKDKDLYWNATGSSISGDLWRGKHMQTRTQI